jgi:hypothetical protein
VALDFKLYKQLWSLQAFFNDPGQCFEGASWRVVFLPAVEAVLQLFKSAVLDATVAQAPDESHSQDDGVFFAKYLTNPQLLELQVADPAFRRQVGITPRGNRGLAGRHSHSLLLKIINHPARTSRFCCKC